MSDVICKAVITIEVEYNLDSVDPNGLYVDLEKTSGNLLKWVGYRMSMKMQKSCRGNPRWWLTASPNNYPAHNMAELNLTLQHFTAFCLMVYVASHFVSGTRLLRLIGWIALWQILSPVRPALVDVPMMIAGWWFTEILFLKMIRFVTPRP